MDNGEFVVGIDIGGSHVGVCIMHCNGKILGEADAPVTNRDQNNVIELIFGLVDDLVRKYPSTKISAIGIGSPGQPKNGCIIAASNFPTWKNVPLAAIIGKRYSVPSFLFKDSDAAFAAEIWGHGSSLKDVQNAVILTLGTGIGCSILINGQFYGGTSGLVEGGHMIIDRSSSSLQCSCGQRGCVEAYASAGNTVKRYLQAAQIPLQSTGANIGAIDIFERAQVDRVAADVLDEVDRGM